MIFKKNRINLLLAFCIIVPSYSFGHSGGTDQYGCHNDNIHGGYHCHNSKSSSSADIDDSVWVTVLVLGVLYWYITDESENGSWLDTSKKNDNDFIFSLTPVNKEKVEGVVFQMSYQF